MDRRGNIERLRVWVTRTYLGFALVLVPWVCYLAISLPQRSVSVHYRGTWVGFDVVLVLVLARIGWLAHRGSPRIILTAAAGAAMLLMDAWFDVTTSAPGPAHTRAVLAAVILEIPAAILSGLLARRALKRLTDVGVPAASAPQPSASTSTRQDPR